MKTEKNSFPMKRAQSESGGIAEVVLVWGFEDQIVPLCGVTGPYKGTIRVESYPYGGLSVAIRVQLG